MRDRLVWSPKTLTTKDSDDDFRAGQFLPKADGAIRLSGDYRVKADSQ